MKMIRQQFGAVLTNHVIAGEADKPGELDMIAAGLLAGREIKTEADLILVPCPFSISCSDCDNGMHIGSREQALAEGWKDIFFDPEAGSYSYVGTCPECQKEST